MSDHEGGIKNSIERLIGINRKQDFVAMLESLGIHVVKARLESKYWGSTQNIAWAKEWIDSREALETAKRREEELSILKEANSIAKDSNRIAVEANKRSDLANRLSVLAVIVSLIAALIAWIIK